MSAVLISYSTVTTTATMEGGKSFSFAPFPSVNRVLSSTAPLATNLTSTSGGSKPTTTTTMSVPSAQARTDRTSSMSMASGSANVTPSRLFSILFTLLTLLFCWPCEGLTIPQARPFSAPQAIVALGRRDESSPARANGTFLHNAGPLRDTTSPIAVSTSVSGSITYLFAAPSTTVTSTAPEPPQTSMAEGTDRPSAVSTSVSGSVTYLFAAPSTTITSTVPEPPQTSTPPETDHPSAVSTSISGSVTFLFAAPTTMTSSVPASISPSANPQLSEASSAHLTTTETTIVHSTSFLTTAVATIYRTRPIPTITIGELPLSDQASLFTTFTLSAGTTQASHKSSNSTMSSGEHDAAGFDSGTLVTFTQTASSSSASSSATTTPSTSAMTSQGIATAASRVRESSVSAPTATTATTFATLLTAAAIRTSTSAPVSQVLPNIVIGASTYTTDASGEYVIAGHTLVPAQNATESRPTTATATATATVTVELPVVTTPGMMGTAGGVGSATAGATASSGGTRSGRGRGGEGLGSLMGWCGLVGSVVVAFPLCLEI